MEKSILSIFALALALGCSQPQPHTTDSLGPSRALSFGAPFEAKGAISSTALEITIAGKDTVQATLTGEIVQSCQAKGCWMDVKLADNRTMKVTFRDYGFFLPVQDLKGRQVVFTGTAIRQETPVEEQRHYAKDAGKTADEIAGITAPVQELRFVADGVILR
ncbi:DUF4920 domain-containing protein [Pontibacter sp. CAU 1760]